MMVVTGGYGWLGFYPQSFVRPGEVNNMPPCVSSDINGTRVLIAYLARGIRSYRLQSGLLVTPSLDGLYYGTRL